MREKRNICLEGDRKFSFIQEIHGMLICPASGSGLRKQMNTMRLLSSQSLLPNSKERLQVHRHLQCSLSIRPLSTEGRQPQMRLTPPAEGALGPFCPTSPSSSPPTLKLPAFHNIFLCKVH